MKADMKPTLLVSGASGLLGSELITQILENDKYKVIALTSKKETLTQMFEGNPNLKVLHIDNWVINLGLNNQIDTLINCAFPRSSKPEELAKGLLFTENIIKGAIDIGVKKVINISSQSVYSQKSKSTTNEASSVAPESLYGMAKYSSERIVATLCENHSITFTNIRLASLTGLNFEVRMTNRFVKNALTGHPITINGGSQRIAYLEVRDAASALIAMLNNNVGSWETVYNLGNEQSCTILDLAKLVKKTAEKYSINKVKLEINDGQNDFNNLIDSTLFYKQFNWQPKYNIKLMVEELFEHYKLGVN